MKINKREGRSFNFQNGINVALIVLFFLSAKSAWGQADSLDHYIETAVKSNPSLQQKLKEYKAALQKVPQAGSLPDPELTAGILLSPMELVNGKQMADIKVMQMFPWFGVLKSAKDEMTCMAQSKYALFRDTELQLIYDVRRTWYELIRINNNIRISKENLELLKSIENLAMAGYKSSLSGNQGLTDIYRIQIETADIENLLSDLSDQLNYVKARFNTYLNRSPTSPLTSGIRISADTSDLPVEMLSDSLPSKNPMLEMINHEKQSHESREKMVRRMGYPMIGIGLDYSVIGKNAMSSSAMNGKDMIMPMITLTLPVYRKKYSAIQAEAALLKSASSDNYRSVYSSLQAEYYQALQMYKSAKRQMKLYEMQYSLSSKSLDLLMKNYTVSASGLSDLLRLRQQVYEYEMKKIEAITDYKTSVAWLRRIGNIESEV